MDMSSTLDCASNIVYTSTQERKELTRQIYTEIKSALCQKEGEVRKNAEGGDKLLDWDKTSELVNCLAFM